MNKLLALCAVLALSASAEAAAPAKSKTKKPAKPAAARSIKPAAAVAAPVKATSLGEIQVTATKQAESTQSLPAHVSVVTGEQLRARGVTDLKGAMALVAGADIAPSGDGGPSGSIPALWGFREFDAFLLVVDDVPVGGAFNPVTTAIDFNNIERIEVLRGSAPVTYGATAFVGVIHIIHYPAGRSEDLARIGVSDRGSVIASASTVLSKDPSLQQSISANVERREFAGARTGFERGQLSYRLATPLFGGRFHADANITESRGNPTQTSRRAGISGIQRLTDDVGFTPFDANHNPADARIDGGRYGFTLGLEQPLGFAEQRTTLSYSHTTVDNIRGFLSGGLPAADPLPARGFATTGGYHELYLDTHLEMPVLPTLNLVAGVDYLFGDADLTHRNFTYTVNNDGSNAQASGAGVALNTNQVGDSRHFVGVYAQTTWRPLDPLEILLGLRFNSTTESLDATKDTANAASRVQQSDTDSRLTGMAGLSYRLWQSGADYFTVYGDYRNTYKPVAFDTGPKLNLNAADLYKLIHREEAYSTEAGIRGAFLNGAFDYELSFFNLDFTNAVHYNPGVTLSKAGDGRLGFQGIEVETGYRVCDNLRAVSHWAYHNSRFLFANTDDGTSVSGKRLEMSPVVTSGTGLIYAPPQGFNASANVNFTGRRFLNKKNSGPLTSFFTGDVGLGYRFGKYSLAVNATNLSDQRDAISESEFSEAIAAASYYRNPAREVMLNFAMDLK